MARPSAYERRNARAQALGYRNYYDYRLHDNGRQPPGPLPQLSSEERSRRRGHRGRKDFLDSLSEGDLIIMPYGLSSVEIDDDGRYVEIVKLVVDGETGQERTYMLQNLTLAQLVDTIEQEQMKGAVFSPSPSLDQRRLISELDLDEGGY